MPSDSWDSTVAGAAVGIPGPVCAVKIYPLEAAGRTDVLNLLAETWAALGGSMWPSVEEVFALLTNFGWWEVTMEPQASWMRQARGLRFC